MMNTRSRASAVEALGLKAQPALALVNNYRDRVYVKTVYHADPFTLSMKLQLRFKGEAAPGAPAGVPAVADLDGALAAAAPPTHPADAAAPPADVAAPAPDVGAVVHLPDDVDPAQGEYPRLLKKYMLLAMRTMLDSSDHDGFFSFSLPRNCLTELRRVVSRQPEAHEHARDWGAGQGGLLAATLTESDKHKLSQIHVGFADELASMLFFKVVRYNPQDVVRPKSEVGASVHELVSIDAESRSIVVSATPSQVSNVHDFQNSQVVLSLSTLSCDELCKLWAWSIKPSLSFALELHIDVLVDGEQILPQLREHALLPEVLGALCSSGPAGLAASDQSEPRSAFLTSLRRFGGEHR
jgi:hypothetical protein